MQTIDEVICSRSRCFGTVIRLCCACAALLLCVGCGNEALYLNTRSGIVHRRDCKWLRKAAPGNIMKVDRRDLSESWQPCKVCCPNIKNYWE